MTDFTLQYRRDDGTFVVVLANGWPYHVVQSDPLYAQVSAAAEGVELPPEPEPESQPTPTRQVEKAVIMSRITDDQLKQAMELMTLRQQERWRMPGYPKLNVDDPELLALLTAIGADPDTVLAP